MTTKTIEERVKAIKEKLSGLNELIYALQEDYEKDENDEYVKDENGYYKTKLRDNLVNKALIEKAESMLF